MCNAAPKTEPLLDLQDIHKIYAMGDQEVRALDGVRLQVFEGDFVAVMGPSGSGKSTLMHIIGCLDVPSSGSYKLDGTDVGEMDEVEQAHLRNRKIGFVFQGFNLLPRTTALENVELPLIYAHSKHVVERSAEVLTRVGLGDRLDHHPNELSGGQQQRVAIARALATDPVLLLADEPTGNLATRQSEEIMQIFQQLNDEGKTIVMVTHEFDIARHCKRIVSMRDGRIVDDQLVDERLLATKELQAA